MTSVSTCGDWPTIDPRAELEAELGPVQWDIAPDGLRMDDLEPTRLADLRLIGSWRPQVQSVAWAAPGQLSRIHTAGSDDGCQDGLPARVRELTAP